MAATQSLRRTGIDKKMRKTLVSRGSTLDSSSAPTTITTTVAKLKRVGVGGRQRKLLTSRQQLTLA